MLHKLSAEKWREVYKIHKTERAGRARSVGNFYKNQWAQIALRRN
jgi:hypothetical protein